MMHDIAGATFSKIIIIFSKIVFTISKIIFPII